MVSLRRRIGMDGQMWKGTEERRAYWAMISPAFILYLLVFGFPIAISIVISLSNYGGGKMFGGEPWRITGVQQYVKLATDPYFWLALKNNIYIVLVSVFGQLPLGLIFAYLIYRRIVRFGEFWQAILYVPAIISVIVIGIMWSIIFSPYGLIAEVVNRSYASSFSRQVDRIFAAAGGYQASDQVVSQLIAASGPNAVQIFSDPAAELKNLLLSYTPDQYHVVRQDLVNLLARKWSPAFLAKRDVAMLPVLFVVLWCWTGFYLILFLANMQRIDSGIVEAARIDGASEGQVIWRIMLPMLSGVVVNAAILCIAGSLNSFALVFAMTGGGPARVTQLLSIYMYDRAFMGAPDFPLANAIALAIVLFSIILIGMTKLVERRYGGRE
jgi:ABC-type sugar transport system permease subunit